MSDVTPEQAANTAETVYAVLRGTLHGSIARLEALDELDALVSAVTELQQENARWLSWSGGRYPDDSIGDVISAQADGTITLDDGITTWEPRRAAAFFKRRAEQAERERDSLKRWQKAYARGRSGMVASADQDFERAEAAEARADTLTRQRDELFHALKACAASAGAPDSAEACRYVIAIVKQYTDDPAFSRAVLAAGDGTTPTDGSTDDDTEKFSALVEEARAILATGDRLAAIAFLTGRTREEVERVCGTTPTGADE